MAKTKEVVKKKKKKSSLIDDEPVKTKKKKTVEAAPAKNAKPDRGEFNGVGTTLKTLMINQKNALRVGTMKFPNSPRPQVDVRRYYQDTAGELRPAKGVMFPLEMLPDVIKQLKRLLKQYPPEDREEADDE